MNTQKKTQSPINSGAFSYLLTIILSTAAVFAVSYFALPALLSVSYSEDSVNGSSTSTPSKIKPLPPLDTRAYDAKLLQLAHVATSSAWYASFLAGTSTVTLPGATSSITVAKKSWPVKATYPADSRALLPFNRIVSYYGNFYSKYMGVLGQYPPEVMIPKLQAAAAEWQAADPSTPVIPAIHYIAMVAQADAGRDGKYRAQMPDSEIDKALALAEQIHGIVFIDLQVGLSDLQTEVPKFEKYLKLPNVHLGVDPEFAMKTSGVKPGRLIGTLDATDINYTAQYLANLVRTYNLPPKVLMIHRFTGAMLTNSKKIKPLPEVQIVVDMDGWGSPQRKKNTYAHVVQAEPVQFAGFKLFYKNDLKEDPPRMLTPKEVLELTPAPSYIQYQ